MGHSVMLPQPWAQINFFLYKVITLGLCRSYRKLPATPRLLLLQFSSLNRLSILKRSIKAQSTEADRRDKQHTFSKHLEPQMDGISFHEASLSAFRRALVSCLLSHPQPPPPPASLPLISEYTASQVHELSNWEPSNKPFLSGTEQFVTWLLACC